MNIGASISACSSDIDTFVWVFGPFDLALLAINNPLLSIIVWPALPELDICAFFVFAVLDVNALICAHPLNMSIASRWHDKLLVLKTCGVISPC